MRKTTPNRDPTRKPSKLLIDPGAFISNLAADPGGSGVATAFGAAFAPSAPHSVVIAFPKLPVKRGQGLSANDNIAGTFFAWTQGYGDGQRDTWSRHLANQHGFAGDDYLAGWMAGSDTVTNAGQNGLAG